MPTHEHSVEGEVQRQGGTAASTSKSAPLRRGRTGQATAGGATGYANQANDVAPGTRSGDPLRAPIPSASVSGTLAEGRAAAASWDT